MKQDARNSHQTQQPLDRLTRLRSDPKPVFGATLVQVDILVPLRLDGKTGHLIGDFGSIVGEGDARCGIVGAQHFHRLRIASGAMWWGLKSEQVASIRDWRVTGVPGLGHDDVIKRLSLLAEAGETDLDHHCSKIERFRCRTLDRTMAIDYGMGYRGVKS